MGKVGKGDGSLFPKILKFKREWFEKEGKENRPLFLPFPIKR